MADSGDTSYWIKFFTDAGIPAGDATNYAITFTDQRIQRSMLLDLTKEYLNDMGVSTMGDVIAILKHAKTVHTQESRARTLGKATVRVPSPRLSDLRRSTPASRTVAHYLGSQSGPSTPEPPPPPALSPALAGRLGVGSGRSSPVSGLRSEAPEFQHVGPGGQKLEVPVRVRRQVLPEQEGGYKITMPGGITRKSKSSPALNRMCDSDNSASSSPEVMRKEGVTITGLNKITFPSAQSSLTGRLTSLKRPVRTQEKPGALQYAGVLKQPADNTPTGSPLSSRLGKRVVRESDSEEDESSVDEETDSEELEEDDGGDEEESSRTVESSEAVPKQSRVLYSDTVEHVNIKRRVGNIVIAAAESTTTPTVTKKPKLMKVVKPAAVVKKQPTAAPIPAPKTGIESRLGPPVETVVPATDPAPAPMQPTAVKTLPTKSASKKKVVPTVQQIIEHERLQSQRTENPATSDVFSRLGKHV